MYWLTQSLNRKFIVGTAAGLLISSLVFLVLFVSLYRAQLEESRAQTAIQINRLLQTSLENAMLKRDLEGLGTIVQHLGDQADIVSVRITNPAGLVRFASDPALLGQKLLPANELPGTAGSRFMQDEQGQQVLRSINPVHNKTACQECHGPMEQTPINGVLYVDYDASPLQQNARLTTLLLMGAGALIVLINLAGGWWFIRRYILRPVNQLAAASKRLAIGDLDARVKLGSKDELAMLGETFNGMAERLQAKLRELREKEQFLQQLVDAIPDGVRIIDESFQVLLANRTCREQLGCRPDAKLTSCHKQAHGSDDPCPETLLTCPVREIARNPQPLKVVHQHIRPDDSRMSVEIYSAPMQVTQEGKPRLLVVESIRDLDQQVKFSHEQKLSELGRLAAGVAHEIHNPLASVRLALHAGQQENLADEPDREQVKEFLDLVDQEVDQCIQVTERLLKLSVPPAKQAELVNLDEIAADTLQLVRWDAENQRVKIVLKGYEPPYRIMATDSEMRMVMINLAQNALHAMPRGGELAVSFSRTEDFIRLVVSDSGTGIAPDDLPHIFEPFFTRRADGVRGTGLGLSITKNIIDNFNGKIVVDSTHGKGSSFIVSFPDADMEDEF